MYPTFDEIKNLHKKYAPNEELFNLVFTHCQIIWAIAEQIIAEKKLRLNIDLVKTGALVHDIATYKYLSQKNGELLYYRHAYEGAIILRKEGFSEEICGLVEHHLGVGLTKTEIVERKLDLPAQDFTPQTVEERLILYADKFHSKTPKFNTFASYSSFLKKYGEPQVLKFETLAKEFGIPELQVLSQKYNHPIV